MMLLNLCLEQQRAGHRAVIASIRSKHEINLPLEKEALRQGLEAVVFRMINGPNFVGAWRILHFARSNGFHILHTHGYKGNILFGFIPRVIRRLPVVSTLHGWTHVKGIAKLGLYEYMDALSLRHMNAVCVVNKSMLNHPRLKNLEMRCLLHHVSNGIPIKVDVPRPLEDEITSFSSEGFTVVTIGRLSVEKGHRDLIESFDLFSKGSPDARLLIIGEGPERGALEEMIKQKGLSGRVLLPGYRDEAWRYLGFCKVFALSSWTEGLPITLLEAMRAGVPVVATAVGGVPYALDHGKVGLLVPSRDIDAMDLALKKVWKDEQSARERSFLAKDRVKREFSSVSMADRYIRLYREVLSPKSR